MAAKSKIPKSYHHPDLRQSLIEAAILFLKSNRSEDLSLRELARNLDVSHTAPYRHFKTKENLLAAVITDGFLKLSNKFDEVGKKHHHNFPVLFKKMGLAYVSFFAQNTDQARLMFSGMCKDHEKYPEAKASGDVAFGKLIEMIVLGQELGFIKKEDPLRIAFVIWSAVHGLATLLVDQHFDHLSNSNPVSPDSLIDYLADRMLEKTK